MHKVIQKKWVVVFCLLLIGCASEETSVQLSTSAVVYEIYSDPVVAVSLGRIDYPIIQNGLHLILENIGEVDADVYIVMETFSLRDSRRLCNGFNDLVIPTLVPGKTFHYIFTYPVLINVMFNTEN